MCVLRFLIFVACLQHGRRNYAAAQNNSDPVLSKLRSQLMADNYDYESESLEETDRLGSENKRAHRSHVNNDTSELSDFTADRNVLNGYVSDISEMNMVPVQRGQNEEPGGEGGDQMFDKEWQKGLQLGLPVSPYLAKDQTSAPLPYKVLTGRGPSARRNSQMLRFLQTEMNDTVLVAPLLPGPMPWFQLPSGRRQYREVSGEDELEMYEDISSAKEDDATDR